MADAPGGFCRGALRGGGADETASENRRQKAGYYREGLPKIELARNIAAHMDPSRNRSNSFRVFCRGLGELAAD